MKPGIFLAALAVIASAAAGSAAAQATKCNLIRIAEWPLRTNQSRPVVEGEINGEKIGILLDSSADQSLLRRSAAVRLGLTRYEADGYRVFGIGETLPDSVLIDEFKIGPAVRRGWRVLVAGEYDFGDEVGFILGDDFLQQVDLEFDLANNAVRLYQAKDCEGVSLAYWTKEPTGEVAIEPGSKIWLTVSINGKPLRAALDSGAERSVLALPDAAHFGITPQSSGVVAAGCAFGTGRHALDSWLATFDTFAIDHELIRNPRIVIANIWRKTEPPLVLGADFLRAHRVLVSRSQRKLFFTYAGGTVFPGRMARGCNDASSRNPGGSPR